MDWTEVLKVAQLPEYNNVSDCKALEREVVNELKVQSYNPTAVTIDGKWIVFVAGGRSPALQYFATRPWAAERPSPRTTSCALLSIIPASLAMAMNWKPSAKRRWAAEMSAT